MTLHASPIAPSVGALFAEPALAWAVPHGGEAGLLAPVTDVQWLDNDSAPRAGALVLAMRSRAEPSYRLDALLSRLHAAGCCGLLLIGEGAPPSDSTVLLAQHLGFPLLTLVHDEPLRLLQELTLTLHAPDAVRALTMDQLLRGLAGRQEGKDILEAASTVLHTVPSLITPDGTVLLGPTTELGEGLPPGSPLPQRVGRRLWQPVLGKDRRSAEAWLVVDVDAETTARLGSLAGGLAVIEPFAAAWLARERMAADRDVVLQRELFTDIVAQGAAVSRSTAERASAIGWSLQEWHTAVHILIHGVPEGARAAELPPAFAHGLGEGGWRPVSVQESGEGWVLWVGSAGEPSTGSIRTFLGGVRRLCNRLPREWGLSVGVGRSYAGPGGLARSVGEAKDAALLAASHDAWPRVEHFDALGIARLLATWQESEVTRSFAETVLAPLRDAQGGTLLATLRAYLDHGASPAEAAAALGVHRNTVGLRLQQIRERLDVDLSDPTLRLAMHVAVRSLPLPPR